MSIDYIQGEPVTFFVNFVDGLSTPIITGVSGVTVDVYHYVNAAQIFDISGVSMTQNIPAPQRFEYLYNIPINSPITNYIVEYNAIYSGTSVQTVDSYNLFPQGTSFITGFGYGNIHSSGTVVDPSGIFIPGVNITVTSGLNTLYAAAFTDPSGDYSVFLDEGSYIFSYLKSGYFPLQEVHAIVSGVGGFDIGTTTLQFDTTASLMISDSIIAPNPLNPAVNIPVPNLKVTLFSIADLPSPPINISVNYDGALQTSYTNASGAWFMYANPGYYIIDVEGMRTNSKTGVNERFKLTRNIEVNTMYPNNFDYLDTSKYSFI